MKKFLSVVCVLALMIVALSGVALSASAAPSEDEWDGVFRNTLEDVMSEENITAESVKVTREPVYDIDLQQLGFIYSMEYDQKAGYALVINTDGTFNVAEFYMEGRNPYELYNGEKIYVNFMLYLSYENETFTETTTGYVLTDEEVDVLREKAFGANSESFIKGSETVYYINKSENKHELARRHPAYYPVGENITNACTPATGANLIGFWTRYYPELVPGFTPGSVAFGIYLYKEWATEADKLVEELFYAMGTNQTAPGTTIADFQRGMNSYISGKGRNISYESCMRNGSFDYAYTKQKLKNNIPLALFVDCFRVDTFWDANNKNAIDYTISTLPHAMAGFGYNDITYTLSDGTQRTDCYIQVATGLVDTPKGYYNINYNTTIDECFAITIY